MRTDPSPFPKKFLKIYTYYSEMMETEFYNCDNVRRATFETVELRPSEFNISQRLWLLQKGQGSG